MRAMSSLESEGDEESEEDTDKQWAPSPLCVLHWDSKLIPMLMCTSWRSSNQWWLEMQSSWNCLVSRRIRSRPIRHVEWSLPDWHASCCRTGAALIRLSTWHLTPLLKTPAPTGPTTGLVWVPAPHWWGPPEPGFHRPEGRVITLARGYLVHTSEREMESVTTRIQQPMVLLHSWQHRATTPGQFTCWTCAERGIKLTTDSVEVARKEQHCVLQAVEHDLNQKPNLRRCKHKPIPE